MPKDEIASRIIREAITEVESEVENGTFPEEPSYMMFARANVRGGFETPASVVKLLLDRIDRMEREKS